ncbi:MAG: hypothetical protein MZV63_50405 [Marinilabiliales bacterium]|nr:hypothetical protein [Marinilabiliales bacterium]
MIDTCMDEAMLDSEKAMVRFVNLIMAEPDISKASSDDRFIALGYNRS